jgi:hypothetical protein
MLQEWCWIYWFLCCNSIMAAMVLGNYVKDMGGNIADDALAESDQFYYQC